MRKLFYASKYVDRKLQPYMKITRSHILSSQSLVLLLEKYKIHDDYKDTMCILCADITSLYPNIPIDTGLLFMRERLIFLHNDSLKLNITPIITLSDISFICELTEFVLNNNYITFGDRTFKQICGTAMGTPLAVVFANLFLQQLEHLVKIKLNDLKHDFPLLYKRYIDDIFALFKCMYDAKQYIETFNSIVESIKVTYTLDCMKGQFLGVVMFRGPRYDTDNLLDVKLYQKPQDKHQYLPPYSFHSPKIFPAFINSELNRLRLNCSVDSDYETNKQLYYTRLLARDYTHEYLKPSFELHRDRNSLLTRISDRLKQKLVTANNNSTSKPIIFKTTYCQKALQTKLKPCFKLTELAKQDPHAHKIFGNRDPIICYQTCNMGQMLSKTQYTHNVTCDNKKTDGSEDQSNLLYTTAQVSSEFRNQKKLQKSFQMNVNV